MLERNTKEQGKPACVVLERNTKEQGKPACVVLERNTQEPPSASCSLVHVLITMLAKGCTITHSKDSLLFFFLL